MTAAAGQVAQDRCPGYSTPPNPQRTLKLLHPAPTPIIAARSLEDELTAELAALDEAGLRRVLRTAAGRTGPLVRTEHGDALDFSSNDYLGLAADPRIAEAGARAQREVGTGAASARLISGNHPLHEALERALAEWKQLPAALLFPSGYAANTGAIPALVRRGDAVYSDALNHASLIDGCRLSRAELRIFPHLDVDALDAMLRADTGRYRRRLIVVDGVFSMDGDLFPLDRLVDAAREHGAWTYVDDAHGSGVLGDQGRGAAERYGVEGELDVVMATLGKALGTAGAFVAGSQRLCEFLLNRARTFVFTTGSPPSQAAASLEALRIVQAEPWRRDRLRENAERLRHGLASLGLPPAGVAESAILPVLLRDEAATVRVGADLRRRGFLVGAIRPPTVPPGTSRLRISVTAAHTGEQVDALVAALGAVL
jgi:8-amino-7-oxononanoate synthase